MLYSQVVHTSSLDMIIMPSVQVTPHIMAVNSYSENGAGIINLVGGSL